MANDEYNFIHIGKTWLTDAKACMNYPVDEYRCIAASTQTAICILHVPSLYGVGSRRMTSASYHFDSSGQTARSEIPKRQRRAIWRAFDALLNEE